MRGPHVRRCQFFRALAAHSAPRLRAAGTHQPAGAADKPRPALGGGPTLALWGASQFLTKQFLSVLYNNQMLCAFASLRSESRSLNVPPRHASTISTLCTCI